MESIAIFGAGAFGREVALLIEQINQHKPTWKLLGFYDDGIAAVTEVYAYKVLGGIDDLNNAKQGLNLVVAVADPKKRKEFFQGSAIHT
jgi:mannitol-1-phosphate/altronate dehydrogenase